MHSQMAKMKGDFRFMKSEICILSMMLHKIAWFKFVSDLDFYILKGMKKHVSDFYFNDLRRKLGMNQI